MSAGDYALAAQAQDDSELPIPVAQPNHDDVGRKPATGFLEKLKSTFKKII